MCNLLFGLPFVARQKLSSLHSLDYRILPVFVSPDRYVLLRFVNAKGQCIDRRSTYRTKPEPGSPKEAASLTASFRKKFAWLRVSYNARFDFQKDVQRKGDKYKPILIQVMSCESCDCSHLLSCSILLSTFAASRKKKRKTRVAYREELMRIIPLHNIFYSVARKCSCRLAIPEKSLKMCHSFE